MPESTAIMPAPQVGEVMEALTAEKRKLLRDQVCPPDTTDDEFDLFLAVASRTGLDPFLRQIYLIPRRTRIQTAQGWRWHVVRRVEVAIGGLQLIATRTGDHDGREGPEWYDGTAWTDVWDRDTPPAAARVRIYRQGARVPFTGTAHYREYVQTTAEGAPTRFWKDMPAHMLAKCAEAIALRAAFPAELNALYVPEERRWDDPPAAPGEVVDATTTTLSVPHTEPPGSQGGPQPAADAGGNTAQTEPPAAPRSPDLPAVDGSAIVLRAQGMSATALRAILGDLAIAGPHGAKCYKELADGGIEVSAPRLDIQSAATRRRIYDAIKAANPEPATPAADPPLGAGDVDPADIPFSVGAAG